MHHFIASPSWDGGALEAVLAADALAGGPDAALVFDDTALPKKGTRSVGVAHQYASALGKNANSRSSSRSPRREARCQSPWGGASSCPGKWTDDPARCAAGVPERRRGLKAKADLALEGIDRLRAVGARFGCVLADAGHGTGAAFRRGLDARGLA